MKNCIQILLGSNVGDRGQYLAKATELLELYLGKAVDQSRIYETAAWGTEESQAAYLNQVLSFRSYRSPGQLVDVCLAIEKIIGRKRTVPNAPRIIDIDLLLMGSLIDLSVSSTVPHPRMHLRRFVLEPLVEICPQQIHPILGVSIEQLLKELDDDLEVTVLTK